MTYWRGVSVRLFVCLSVCYCTVVYSNQTKSNRTFIKHPLKPNSQRRFLHVGTLEESSLKTQDRSEMFPTDVTIKSNQITLNLFFIRSVHNITIHEFALRLARQTGDNFALMSAHDNQT